MPVLAPVITINFHAPNVDKDNGSQFSATATKTTTTKAAENM